MSEEHRDDYRPLSTTAANIRIIRLLLAGLLLAGFDVYVWYQCYAMEQSLRIE